MVQRSLSLVLFAGLMSCSGDPTGDLRNGTDHLISDPSSLFVGQDSTKLVTITAVDEQGNTVAARFSDPTAVGPGITVAKDLTFQPVFDDNGNLVPPKEVVATRYTVTATANTANSSFTVNAGGKSITIPVRIIPVALNLATASAAAPNAGDTVTITLPDPYRFTPASAASISGTALFKVSTAADSTSIKVVAGPGLNAPVSVTGVKLSYATGATTLTVTTTASVTTPAIPVVTASKTNAAIGDTVVLTAVAPYKFIKGPATDSSVVNIGAATRAITAISADSSQMRFVIGPGSTDTIRVTNLKISGAATLGPFTTKTNSTLTTPAQPFITLNKTSGVAGDTIVVTAPAGFRFTTAGTGASSVTVGTAGLALVGFSADSGTMRFLIGPAAGDTVRTTGMRVRTASILGPYTTKTNATLTTPALTAQTAGFSTTTPNINQSVTVTAPAGYKFLPTAKVFFGLDQQAVASVAADSNSLIFRAHKAGASGAISVGNAALSFLPTVPITMATTNTATVAATINSLAGTDALATAPRITIPDAGKTGGIIDAGAFATGPAVCSNALGGPCRIYKFTISTARTFAVSATWQGTTDLGIYFSTDGIAFISTLTGCDAKGATAAGQPEACTVTALAAGTYYLVVDSFSPFYGPPDNVDPTDFNVAITGQ